MASCQRAQTNNKDPSTSPWQSVCCKLGLKTLSERKWEILLNPFDSLLVLPCGNIVTTLDELKAMVSPSITQQFVNYEWLCERAKPDPKNTMLDEVKTDLLRQLPSRVSSIQ